MYVELKSKLIKTKKPHKCSWCAEQINTRNLAIYRVYIFEGDFSYDYMHPECTEALKKMSSEFEDEITWMPGEFKKGECHA